MSESLIGQFIESQNFAHTTARARRYWLESWEQRIGKPLEEGTTADILTLKKEFATHKGRVPLKYAQTLRGFYAWVVQVRPGFVDPSAAVVFEAGEDPPTKDALPVDVMARILDEARRRAEVSNYREGPEVVKDGRHRYDLRKFLWFKALQLGPGWLLRVHEIFPYRACHRLQVVDPERYHVKCREGGCAFEAEYWQDAKDPNAVRVIVDDPGHVENEKVKDFRFGKVVDKSGKEWAAVSFRRKGRVKRNRSTGRSAGEVHWSTLKPIGPEDLKWLRLLVVVPPKSTQTATRTLAEYGELFGLELKDSKGKALDLTWHLFAKHSSVTARKLRGDSSAEIARDADVSEGSLRPYDHTAEARQEVSRQTKVVTRFWNA